MRAKQQVEADVQMLSGQDALLQERYLSGWRVRIRRSGEALLTGWFLVGNEGISHPLKGLSFGISRALIPSFPTKNQGG